MRLKDIKIPPYLKNKFFLTAFAFFIWMVFFDQNNLIRQVSLRAELMEINRNHSYYLHEIEHTRTSLEELLTDDEKLEKFARERYYMKRPNEDVFLFVEED